MVNSVLKEFAERVEDNDPEKASELIDEILREKKKNLESRKVEEIPKVGRKKVNELKSSGYSSIKDIVEGGIEELSKVPKIVEKDAENIYKSCIEEIEESLSCLPGVGPDKAENIRENGFYSVKDLANASIEEVKKIPNIGEKGAQKIINSAKDHMKEEMRIDGYRRALQGILATLDSDRVLTLPRKISEGKYSKEELETIKKEMETRASHKFRPEEERGFNEAWRDLIEVIS